MPLTITTELADAAAQRFWTKVAKGGPSDCWEWQAYKGRGYGTLKVIVDRKEYTVKAHRISYVLHHGEIPSGLVVRHTCDNPSCVNPVHLLVGTFAENSADMSRRGRCQDQRGELNPCNRLSDAAVRDIIALLEQPLPPSQRQIARQFGISQATVSLIRLGERWSHIPRNRPLNRAPTPRGEKAGLSKLSEDDVRKIRALLSGPSPPQQRDIAAQFGVGQSAIGAIKRGQTWTHVT